MSIQAARVQEQRISEQQKWQKKLHEAAVAGDCCEWMRLQAEYLRWDSVVSQSRADMVRMLDMALGLLQSAGSKQKENV